MRKVQVTFTDEQTELFRKFRGILGDSDAEIIRGIVLSWLAEKSFISDVTKEKYRGETSELNKK